jgi:hypothetical protein
MLSRKVASGRPSRRETSCRRSISGSRRRRSMKTPAISDTAATAMVRIRAGDVQPHSEPNDRPSDRLARPRPNATAPGRSNRLERAPPAKLNTRLAINSPMRPRGTFTKKIQRQPRLSVMRPPRVGPAVTPSETISAFRPRAWPRWLLGKASTMRASAGAKINAAPRPWSPRAATRRARFGARPEKAEPTVKRARPPIHTRSRPAISASRLNDRSVAAMTTR